MPRIRSLKPDINEDEAVGLLSDAAYRLFIGLIATADDDGRHAGNAGLLRSKVFPWEGERDLGGIGSSIADLHDARLVILYAVDGKPYIQIRNWTKHQKVDKRFYKPSKFPPPPADAPPPGSRGDHDVRTSSPRDDGDGTPQSAPRDHDAGEEWRGGEGSGEEGSCVAPADGRATAAVMPISPFTPIVQRLDAVAFARSSPSPKVDAALRVCGEFSSLDLTAAVEAFAHYYVDGPGSTRDCGDVVWKWRLWLRRESERAPKAKVGGGARGSVTDELRELEAEHAAVAAEEASRS